MNAPTKFPLACHPIGPAPLRRAGSIRRTSTIDTSWPEGYGQPMVMQGHARDVWTPTNGGAPVVLAEDRYTIVASARREILSIATTPDRLEAQQLVGVRAGGESRAALTQIMAKERIKGSPLYLILDDYAGASLVAGWVWSLWVDDWRAMAEKAGLTRSAERSGTMEGVCTGFSPGSSALPKAGPPNGQSCTPVPSLLNSDDPDGWHTLTPQDGIGIRRARRIDVWREGEGLAIDIGFQDSGTTPQGGDRMAIHEYHVAARAEQGKLVKIDVDPRILPFVECPGAVAHAQRMLDAPLADLRSQVLSTLPGILGCTHLNDVLRSMAEVPQLAAKIKA